MFLEDTVLQMTTLNEIIESIRTFPGVTRKRAIHTIVDNLPLSEFPQVVAAEGEDAAAIDCGDNYVLFATDGIMESLLNTDPFYAGYYAVLVNVNDIAAMGGKPMAMVDVLSMSKSRVCNQILKGIARAVKKFNVPVVGGHTHPDCHYNAIDISIIGTVPKGDLIRSTEAADGDDIVFVIDLDGYFLEGLKYAWDTTSKKDDELVQKQMELMTQIAARHLVNSGKDMSNPGCIGTLGMMLESSGMGGDIEVEKIPMPEGVDMIQWILAYQGCGFVFSCPPGNSEEVLDMFANVGCAGAVVGNVNSSSQLRLSYRGETKVLFDFDKDIITGCRPKKD